MRGEKAARPVGRGWTIRTTGAAMVCLALSLTGCGGARTAAGSSGAAGNAPAAFTSNCCAAGAPINPNFYGVNFDYAGAAMFAHAKVDRLLSQLSPGTLRWPGGTEADFFDWRSGRPTNKLKSFRFGLARLAAAYRATGAAPIFDLNVLAPGNRTSVASQVAMLRAAQKMGLPITYVEIGNELYGGGAFRAAFPDGSSYGRTVAIYVRALHQDFPGVQVAADAVLAPADARQAAWNREVLSTATGPGAPDAFILHDYPGVYYKPFRTNDLPPLFSMIGGEVQRLGKAADGLRGKSIWLTEYNFRGPYRETKIQLAASGPNPVQSSFARELYLAAFALMLPRVPHLQLVDNWAALNGQSFSAFADPRHPVLTPGGQAVAMIDAAAHGAHRSAAISVPGASQGPSSDPAAFGQAFWNPGGPMHSVFVNLGSRPERVPVGPWVTAGAPYQQVSGNPLTKEPESVTARHVEQLEVA